MIILLCLITTVSCDSSARRDSEIIRNNIEQIKRDNTTPPMSGKVPQYAHTNQHITVKLTKKGKLEHDKEKFYPFIPIELKIKNVSDKNLNYINSKIFFKDKDNNILGYTSIEVNEKIEAGKEIKWSGKYIMSSTDEHQNFIDAKPKNINADATAFSFQLQGEELQELKVWF
jgi:hypothetical protein